MWNDMLTWKEKKKKASSVGGDYREKRGGKIQTALLLLCTHMKRAPPCVLVQMMKAIREVDQGRAGVGRQYWDQSVCNEICRLLVLHSECL